MPCGYPFIYNGVPSETYDCSLAFIDENYNKRPSGSGIEITTDTIQRNARAVFLNAKQTPPLEFGIEIIFEKPVDIFVFTQIKDWLGGEISFKQLQICAEYFDTFYYNCYLELKEDYIYNGGYRGLSATVHCDAPWAWEFEDERSYELKPNIDNHIFFNNLSADTEMLRPIIEFTMIDSGDFSITNLTNQNRVTKFSNLTQGETITMDNLYGFIDSSLGIRRVSNFNKVFLKMPKGMNELICNGNCNKLKIKFQNAKRIGGGYY